MANFQFYPALPQDGPEILQLFHLAFSQPREPMFFVLFPTSEDIETAVQRMWHGGENEDVQWVKIVDSETGL
jgi:hypothetical protein